MKPEIEGAAYAKNAIGSIVVTGMQRRWMAALLFSTAIASAASGADRPRVEAGEWETTLLVEGSKPAITRYCITAADAKAMSGDEAVLRQFLEQSTRMNTSGRCAVKSVKLDGDTSVVKMVCGRTEIATTTKFYGDRYEATSSTGSTVTGKRLGVCRER